MGRANCNQWASFFSREVEVELDGGTDHRVHNGESVKKKGSGGEGRSGGVVL
jgi:hypothetical protein